MVHQDPEASDWLRRRDKSQRSEVLLAHGMLDAIVKLRDMREMKATLSRALRFIATSPVAAEAALT